MKQPSIDKYLVANCLSIIDEFNIMYDGYNKRALKKVADEKYNEMMLKEQRPYVQVITSVNGLKFAIPLRSEISHSTDVLWTDKQARHGLDFTKAVLLLNDDYLSDKRVYIRDKEHRHLLGKERRVQEKMEKCINNYKKAKANMKEAHNAEYCSYSTLQYFEEYIFLIESERDKEIFNISSLEVIKKTKENKDEE